MDRAEEARLFHEGIKLFNDGEWFEAHETWEDIWRSASGDQKRFYQGIIQCAVVIEHMRRGNPRGVLAVFKTALTKFVGLPDVYMGLNIPELVGAIRRMAEPIEALPESMFEPRKGRGLELPVDLKQAPKIKLDYDPFG